MSQGCMPGEWVGYGSSNRTVRLNSSEPQQLLNIDLPSDLGTRREGLATIHFTAAPLSPDDPIDPTANSKVVINVKWQAGSGGGECDVDGDHGMIFAVGAATSIVATARFESAVTDAPLVIGTTYQLEATVKWLTSGRAGASRITLPSLVVGEAGATAWVRIPKMARDLSLMCSASAGYATLVGQYSRNGATAVVDTLVAPRRELVPGGVEFFRAMGRVADVVTPVFYHWTA